MSTSRPLLAASDPDPEDPDPSFFPTGARVQPREDSSGGVSLKTSQPLPGGHLENNGSGRSGASSGPQPPPPHKAGVYESFAAILQDNSVDEGDEDRGKDASTVSAAELVRQILNFRRRGRWTWRDDLGQADALAFPDESFTGPEADVLYACGQTGFSFRELTGVVLMSKDTILLPFDIVAVGPDLFREMGGRGAAGGKMTLTVDEILTALNKPRVRSHVASLRLPILNACLLENTMKTLQALQDFEQLSLKGEGCALDLEAWMLFLRNLLQKRIDYANKLHLLRQHKFAGLGFESKSARQRCSCLFPRGFVEDFARYTRNNHPLLILCLADPHHPFTRSERRVEFAGALITNFAAGAFLLLPGAMVKAGLLSKHACEDTLLGNVLLFLYSVIVSTVPTTLFRQATYLLFATPCLAHDETTMSREVTCCIEFCGLIASSLGHAIVCVWSTVFLVVGCLFWFGGSNFEVGDTNDDDDADTVQALFEAGVNCETSRSQGLAIWAEGVVKYWAFWFIGVLLFDFNPSRGFSKCLGGLINGVASALTCWCCRCSDLVTVGQWHAERAMVLGCIRTKIDLRGEKRFHIADYYTPYTPPMSPMGSFG